MFRVSDPKEYIRLILFSSIILLFMFGLSSFPRITLPLLVSYIIFLISLPLFNQLMKLGLSRMISSIILLVGLLFISFYPIVKVVPLIVSETEKINYYLPKIEKYLKREYTNLELIIEEKTGYKIQGDFIEETFEVGRESIRSLALLLPRFFATLLEWIFILPLFVFFILKDADKIKRKFLLITPNAIFERFYTLTNKFNQQIGGYILAKAIEASIVGLIIFSGLLIFDIRFSLVFALIAVITNIIPYLGPIFGMIPAAIFTLVEHGVGGELGAVIFLFVIANAIDIAIVFPILVSKIVDLHPIIVVGSVILGSQMLGILGMIISIPVAAAVKLVALDIYESIYSNHS